MDKRLMRTLRRIAEAETDPHFQAAGYFGSDAEKRLEKMGLIHSFHETKALGGPGAIGRASVKWHLCRLTDEGQKALAGGTK